MLFTLPALALATISVQQPQIVATNGQQPTAIYMTLTNSSNETVNLSIVQSEANARLEMHGMQEGKMVPVSQIAIPAHGKTTLQYGGAHIMVFDLTAPLRVGQTFPLTLLFDDGEVLNVQAKVINH